MYACDAHVHIWTPEYPPQASTPFPRTLATRASTTDLLASMDRAGVTSALLVQPLNYLYDHTYLFTAASAHPSRFHVIALADVTTPPAQTRAQVRSVVAQGAVGLRVNPALVALGFSSPSVAAALDEAGRLGVPVALFVKGLAGVEALALAHRDTSIVLDHFGVPFVDGERRDGELRELLALARRCGNLYVKASAFFRVSERDFPYQDRCATVVSLVEALGAERVLFGTDFPYVVEECSYGEAWEILRKHVPISKEDVAMVGGGSAKALYNLKTA